VEENTCRIWSLPYDSYSDAVYLQAGVIPVFNDISRLIMNFFYTWCNSDSALVRDILCYMHMSIINNNNNFNNNNNNNSF